MEVNKELISGGELIIKMGEIKYPITEHILEITENILVPSDIITYYSISKDDKNYTDWVLIEESDWFESLTPNIPLFVKLKLTFTSVIQNTVFIKNITLVQNKPEALIVKQGESIALSSVVEEDMLDYAEMGVGLVKLETDLNYYLNKHVGIGVNYFHTNPDKETKDDFLKEYSLHNVVGNKEIKVVVTDNKTPIPRHEFSQWGIEFEKLEIYIEKTYFEESFGVNESPRAYDYIYFKELNRMYYIEDVNLEHGINEVGNFYTCVIKKYEDISAVAKDEDSLEFLQDHIVIDDFTEQQKLEMEDNTNFQQNIEKDIVYDIVRELISEKVVIMKDEFTYKSSPISDYFYNMIEGTSEVIYKSPINLDNNSGMSIMFWIKPIIQNLGKPDEIRLQGKLLSIGDNFDLYANDITKPYNLNIPQDYNGFLCCVVSINNQFNTMSKFVYELTDNGLNKIDYSSVIIDYPILLENSIFKLLAGSYDIRTIRVSNYIIQDQYHQYIMLAKNVKKSSAFTIIDDCEPITNLRKIKKTVFPQINKETFHDVV